VSERRLHQGGVLRHWLGIQPSNTELWAHCHCSRLLTVLTMIVWSQG
jgi:hypothetical protein